MSEKAITKNAGRNSNIEWLRIVSMLLIIAYHATRADFPNTDSSLFVYCSKTVIGSFGILGVDLFVIISAYFLVDKPFNTKKVVGIVFQVLTYVTAYYILFVITYALKHKNVVEAVIQLVHIINTAIDQPLWAEAYWFITAYIFMLLCSPFLNWLINNVSEKNLRKAIIVGLFVPIYAQFDTSVVCDIVYFLYVYLLIGYVKNYKIEIINKYSKVSIIVIIALTVISAKIFINVVAENHITNAVIPVLWNTFAATGRHSMIMLIEAIMMFFCVQKLPKRNNKIVNKVASNTLGIYLFHETNLALPNTLDVIMEMLIGKGFFNSVYLFPVCYIAAVVSIFVIGLFVEHIRKMLVQDPCMRWMDRKFSSGFEKIDRWFRV